MAIDFKFFIIISIIAILSISIIFIYFNTNNTEDTYLENTTKSLDFSIDTTNVNLVTLDIDSIFKISGVKDEYIIEENIKKYKKLYFELNEKNQFKYDDLINSDNKTVVVYPIFTAVAYNVPGFYNYYSGECNENCLVVPIKPILRTEIGGNAAQILNLLDYQFITDIQIDKNPKILENFDKVILLHNEYVTKKEFNAITSHPNVIYLYPNSLYAEIEANYEQNVITLLRGHGYPDKNIINGFNWKFDNTHPYEYDLECNDWNFYSIDNGYMLNCYPEELIYEDELLLKTLKEL